MVFSRETFPAIKIKDAVRISMSVPLYFRAVFIDSKGKTYSRQNKSRTLHIVVDGGITGNFPIHLFDSVAITAGKTMRIPNQNTLGIRIDSDEQIEYDSGGSGLSRSHPFN